MRIFVVTCALALTGWVPALALACSEEWEELGKLDGMSGLPAKQMKRHAKPCEGARDRAAYERGRQEGLKTYCTSENGYIAATENHPYRKVCSSGTVAAFLEGHRNGRRMATVRLAVANADKFAMCAERHLQNLQKTIEENTGKLGPLSWSNKRALQAEESMNTVRARVASLEKSRDETRALCQEKVREHAEKGYPADETLCFPEPLPTVQGGGFRGLLGAMARMAESGCSEYDAKYNKP